ncbi:hypothetical protein B5G18_14745 [Clostridium perfringens]|uniref:hypothetical protein n=1 Tax=Clostridium perfringens TaxID=1502 RepID=UPI000B3B00EA|nr:hypothetical protein [Clostridium perfringens]OUN49532.1 hypothetical protein B5G18_14745 [Clostridium perfringens]OUP41498.1 hypothetical protein B5F20_14410 [Clostridium perfringens]
MGEEINTTQLNELAKIGSNDSMSNPDSKSIATSIAASIAYCSQVVSAITVVVDVSLGASILFSCSNNSAQCG